MAYHITYQKVETYEMPDDKYKTGKSWKKDILKSYRDLRAYTKTPEAPYRIQPASMKDSHQSRLENALIYRIKNKGGTGAEVFREIIGEYSVNIDDMSVIEKRMKVLGEILDIFNSDIKLTTEDPNPSGRHLGEEQVIELKEISLEAAIRQALLVVAYQQQGKFKIGAIMGFMRENFPQFKEEMPTIATIVKKDIGGVKDLFNTGGVENLKRLIGEEFPDITLIPESIKEEKQKKEKIVYFFSAGDYSPNKVYYELSNGNEKEIEFNQLIRKMKHDKNAQKKLHLLKPGGPEWPLSAAGNYSLVISNDPFLVATKSTGRVWANTSCENYDGAYSMGPFSDIRFGNCVVYIFEADKPNEGWPILFNDKTLKGRTLLRWGLKDNMEGQYGVGVERRVYPSNKKWGIPMATAIGMILQEKGLLNYKKCVTPYRYQGWSDTMGTNNVQISYAGLRMEGKKIDVQKLVFAPELNLAGSPTISYSDLHRLSRASMDIRVKRELAQNPSIWQFPEVIGRLLRLNDDIIVRQLVYHSIANGHALDTMAKMLPALNKDYWIKDTSILWGIIKHHNTLPETHQWLVDNHPGWGKNTSFLDWAYLDQPMCYAPPHLLDSVLSSFEGYVKGHFVFSGKKIYIDPVDFKEYKTKKGLENYMKKMTHEGAIIIGGEREGLSLRGINKILFNIIFSPHMSKKQFTNLLNIIISNFSDYPEFEKDTKELSHMKRILGFSVMVPLSNSEDWGFTNKGLDKSFSDGAAYGISLSSLNTISKEWQSMFKIDRQFKRSILSVALFAPWIQRNPSDEGFYPLIENLRSEKLYAFLWENRIKLKYIPSLYYCMLPRSPIDFSVPSNKIGVSEEIIMGAYEETEDEEIRDFQYNFLPNDTGLRLLRKEVPTSLINILLGEKGRISQIGYGVVALWLQNRLHFEIFEDRVMEAALGNRWDDGDVLELPDVRENLGEYLEVVNNLHLSILQTAAIGEEWQGGVMASETGLVYNSKLPEKLQYNLLNNWETISQKFQGDYSDYLSFVEIGLSRNSNTSSNLLNRLKNKEYLREFIAGNPNTPLSLLTGHKGGGRAASLYYDYPVEVLTNPALSGRAFLSLWEITFDFLTMPIDEDVERLFNLFTEQRTNLLNSQGKDARTRIQTLLSLHPNWLRYWRGGSVKKGVFSPYENQNLFKEEGGISDYPILIEGAPFIFFKFSDDNYSSNELYYVQNLKFISDDRYEIKGTVWNWDGDQNIFISSPLGGVVDINDFYEYIIEGDRGSDYILYSIKLENHRRKESTDRHVVEQFIEGVNDEEDMDYSLELIEEKERVAEKWNFPNLFTFKDNDPPKKGVIVPQWRYRWNKKMLDSILQTYLHRQNPQYLIKLWEANPYRIDSSEVKTSESAILDAKTIFDVIDKNELWTAKLVNANLPLLMANRGQLLNNLQNVPLTKKLLEVSLLYKKGDLKKYGLTPTTIPSIQQKILTYPNLPPSYLYALYNIATDDMVIRMIKDLRMKMPSEFNQYLLDNAVEHPEGDL